MSITAETAAAHANDPAVLCCRLEAGNILTTANFEDPGIFPDLIDAGLLNVDGALKLGQCLNGKTKITKTCDSLTALTPDICEGFDAEVGGGEAENTEDAVDASAAPGSGGSAASAGPAGPAISGKAEGVSIRTSGGTLVLEIGEGKNIRIEFPI